MSNYKRGKDKNINIDYNCYQVSDSDDDYVENNVININNISNINNEISENEDIVSEDILFYDIINYFKNLFKKLLQT